MPDDLREPKGHISQGSKVVDSRFEPSNESPAAINVTMMTKTGETDSSLLDEANVHSSESVYTNLIIVEHALRSQYIELQRSRRRGLLFFWGVLTGALFLTYRVRYDASIYKMIRLIEQLLMIAFYIAAGLFFLTGMYTKVFSVAPRFLIDTNKGLKTLNFRMVKTETSFKEKLLRLFINPVLAEDPAGPVKLMLSPREFSPHYIEDWEIFRDDYWERQRRRRQRAKRSRPKVDKKVK